MGRVVYETTPPEDKNPKRYLVQYQIRKNSIWRDKDPGKSYRTMIFATMAAAEIERAGYTARIIDTWAEDSIEISEDD